jgi:predicted RNA-binding Zn-ribbon protein involved in translation (DUF1610 family)
MLTALMGRRLFPCPICGEGLDVRETRKRKPKPYVVCDRCGVQMFVQTPHGIAKFEQLVAEAQTDNIWGKIRELQKQYQRKCPKCGRLFWVSDELIATSWFDGGVIGYRCPEPECDGIAKLEEKA